MMTAMTFGPTAPNHHSAISAPWTGRILSAYPPFLSLAAAEAIYARLPAQDDDIIPFCSIIVALARELLQAVEHNTKSSSSSPNTDFKMSIE